MKQFIRKIWKDPVWSKIIAATIISSFMIIYSKLIDEWNYYKVAILILVGIVIILTLYIRLLLMRIQRLYYYDREYETVKVNYLYTLNINRKALDIKVINARKIKCLKGRINHVELGFGVDECFHNYKLSELPILLKQERNSNKQIIIHEPHKNTKSEIKFRVEFHPPLVENETAYFEYTFAIQEFKFATLESLKEAVKNSVVINRNFEYNSFLIDYPIKEFEYKIEFENKCGINSADLEVTRYTDMFREEDNIIKKSDQITKRYYNANGNYIIAMKRINPPFRAQYRWKWYPPKESMLNNI